MNIIASSIGFIVLLIFTSVGFGQGSVRAEEGDDMGMEVVCLAYGQVLEELEIRLGPEPTPHSQEELDLTRRMFAGDGGSAAVGGMVLADSWKMSSYQRRLERIWLLSDEAYDFGCTHEMISYGRELLVETNKLKKERGIN